MFLYDYDHNASNPEYLAATHEKIIDGPTLMADIRDNGTVDNCHPSDSGFASMAKAIAPVLRMILEGRK